MKWTGRKFTAVMAGAVLLASGAYGIGTQVGGGGAAAGGSSSAEDKAERAAHSVRFRRGHVGPAALAKKLGVEEAKLVAALKELRTDMKPPAEGRAGHKDNLAKALGVSEDKLRAALEKLHSNMAGRHAPGGKDGLAAALAKEELDLKVDDVKAALKKLRGAHEAAHMERRAAFAKALAEKLDIPVDKVLAALPKHRPGGPGRFRDHGGHGGRAGDLHRGGPPPGAFDGPGGRPGSFSPDGPPSGGGLKF